MAYTPKGYTTKAAIEAYLGRTLTESDAVVDGWIATAEEMIDTETGRDFGVNGEESDTERLYDGDGTGTLYIGPAQDITEVYLDAAGEPIDESQYVLYPANKEVKDRIKLRYLRFPAGLQNVKVVADFGAAEVKADINFAATALAGSMANNARPSSSEVQSMTVGRYSVTYRTNSQKDDLSRVQDILDLNKKYEF